MPCTTLLVGKKASYDGSTIIARNEDSPGGVFTPKKLAVVQPADQPRHYRSVQSHVEIDLPENPMRYTAVPDAIPKDGIWAAAGVNEKNVAMSATETLTSNERVLGADPLVALVPAQGEEGADDYLPETPGGIGEEDMVTIVLPYISSAREGVLLLGSYLERFGTYEMNGIAFSDADEIWWLETVGGHHWIAARVPDDCYVTMPNQLGIDAFDLKDALGNGKDFLCSADLAEWMDANHLDLTLDYEGDGPVGFAERERAVDSEDLIPGTRVHRLFNPREAFGSHSDADHVYNTPRAWDLHRFLNPRLGWNRPDANWGPEDDDIPWALPPARKVTIEDVKYALSLHYQGTPYDPYGAAGTPATRGSYRPIGINRNGQLAVIQLRPYGPEECRALQWMAFGSNAFNALVPLFTNVNRVPEYLSNTGAQVTTESFYWTNRIVAALADAHFNACAAHIERYQEAVGSRGHALVAKADAAMAGLEKDDAGANSPAAAAGGASTASAASGAAEVLESANDEICVMLREKTDELLDNVLLTASLGMKNAFARSDG